MGVLEIFDGCRGIFDGCYVDIWSVLFIYMIGDLEIYDRCPGDI